MAERTIKMPDIGEGVAEAELVEWQVKVGDLVREDDVLAAVMTDKATVEIPAPQDGEIVWLGAEVGDIVAVGSAIVRMKISGDKEAPVMAAPQEPKADPTEVSKPKSDKKAVESEEKSIFEPEPEPVEPPAPAPKIQESRPAPRAESAKPLASPAVRQRAQDLGIDLRQVAGSGPAGRISHEDLDAFVARAGKGAVGPAQRTQNTAVEEIKVVGLRRKIAEKMSRAKSRIPHITYVEEIDVTALEDLRGTLNASRKGDQPKLTILPFLMQAMVKAVGEQPALNAIYDDDAGIIHRHGGVHVGIATQTGSGLLVTVVHHAESMGLWDSASEIGRLSEAARNGTATREELSGSTITITSLGAMGGVVTTPVINYPEVAIVGVNKIMTRPMWDGSAFIPRKMMNLSSSFDHRVIDGWDAAVFVQRIKALLEQPALIFIGD